MAKRIYIDPGHSNIDPGAVSYEVERDLNEKVSKFMNEHLLANYACETKVCPITVDSLSAIAADANSWGADLFVSNHFNAGGGDGYEALVHNESRVPLGRVFEDHVKAIGQNSRGVKIRPNLAVLRLTNMPAVLNESAFVDNWNDIQDWNDDSELKRLGIAYAKAAAEFLGLPKKATDPEPQPEVEEKTVSIDLPVLSNGAEGKTVAALQILLIGYGYNCGGYGADGDFGNGTYESVRNFQHDRNLKEDGICGANTWSHLLGMK